MVKRIAILTGNHLCHNPRVLKEADALGRAGFCVEVFGGWSDPVLKARDQELLRKVKFRFVPVHDLTEKPALRLWLRVRGRLAGVVQAKTDRESRWQLGYCVSALWKAIRGCQPDLAIAHSEQALWVVAQLQNKKEKCNGQNSKLGVDMEDWFSEDLPPEARRKRPLRLLRRIEHEVLRNACHATSPSRAMRDALAREHQCRPPTVVYNAFPWSDRRGIDGEIKDRRDLKVTSIHWYSRTLGLDRGLDALVGALPQLKHKAEIHLRGKPVSGFDEWLANRVPAAWRSRIFVHDLVSNDELLSRIAEHDIGFAGEMNYCRNKDCTVSNKMLHYLLAGLGVVASDTAGQVEVAQKAGAAVRIYSARDPATLAKELNNLLGSPEALRAAKAAALVVAERSFCWERQAPALLRSVQSVGGGN